ncbi:MAG: 50S ribosomal protein L23 [Verrucomicrobiae bacterium]|nr:50S ribosomal protein L23 [Verrucomicrobiae bacterium]
MNNPFQIIKTVRVTEKGTMLAEKNNQYVLSVDRRANKFQIKTALQKIFNVTVVGVRTMNCEGKVRRQQTRQAGRCSHWKKAIVTLKEGEKIEVTA